MARIDGATFFRAKKPWSRRKDRLLTEYLPNYLPKVAHFLKRPVYVVDGFAGPGKFGDGEPGSPLLIAGVVEKAISAGLPTALHVLCVEKEPDMYTQLEVNTDRFPFVLRRAGKFLDHLPEIRGLARGNTLFLYLDPYTVEGLEWDALAGVFALLREGQSVEVLANFNSASFVRRGLAALKQAVPAPDPSVEDADELDPIEPGYVPPVDRLNAIVGGDWWQPILARSDMDFAGKVAAIRDGFCSKLGEHFREVCVHDVKAEYHHTVPKYSMVFASRTPVALRLMNDAMVASREMVADATAGESAGLFWESRPKEVVPDPVELDALLVEQAPVAPVWTDRDDLFTRVARARIGSWSTSEMGKALKPLLKSGRLVSETGGHITNHKTRIQRPAART
jgi:hypothetical protein